VCRSPGWRRRRPPWPRRARRSTSPPAGKTPPLARRLPRDAGTTGVRPGGSVGVAPPVSPNLAPRPELAAAKKVGRNTLETLLFRGLSTPTALLFVIVQSRLLEPEGRGEFVVVVLGATIVSRLLGQLGVAVTSRLRESPIPVVGLTQRALLLGGALGAIGTPIMAGVTAASGQVTAKLAIIGALGIVPNIGWQTVSGVLLGQGRLRLWNVIQLLSPVLALAALIVLVAWLDTGVSGALGGWALANGLTAVFAIVAARDLWLPARFPWMLDGTGRTILRLAVVMGAVQVVALVSYRAELFVLGRESGNAAVGIYSIALQAVESMWLVPAAIATAVTAPVVAATDDAQAAHLIARSSFKALWLAVLIAGAVGAVGPFLIPAAFGHEFKNAVVPLELLLPGVVLYAPVTVLVVYLSVRRGEPWWSLIVAVASLAVTLGSALLLIPAHGANGAALASSVGYAAGGAIAWGLFVWLRRRGYTRSTQ
jgi:O-antigen/teichoic acid export membrane protein